MPRLLSRGLVILALCSVDAFAQISASDKTQQSQQDKQSGAKGQGTNTLVFTLQGDSRLGKIQAEENRCTECHGIDGNGQSNAAGSLGIFPKLAGQNPNYLWKQINEFRRDQRHSDIMAIMARSVDDADTQNILAYYASLPKMQGKSTIINAAAEKLFNQGDGKRGILPCTSCHGVNGKGIEGHLPIAPIIGGQDKVYLQKQLQDWRSGERNNSPDGVMNVAAKPLSEDEINGLADYLSGL